MNTLSMTIEKKDAQDITIKMDANKFERLAANFGFFNPDFLKSLSRAEKDFKVGRFQKIKSLRDLRTK